jgi:hypothetical protein
MKRFVTSITLLLLVLCATAQKEYYTSVDGVEGGAALKTALYELIKNHNRLVMAVVRTRLGGHSIQLMQ